MDLSDGRAVEAAGLPPDDAHALGTTITAALEGSFVLARAARRPDPVLATGRMARALVDATLAGRVRLEPRRR